MKTYNQFITELNKFELAMNEDALDENLRPLVKGASYLMRKLAKKSKTFNNLAKKDLLTQR